LRLLNLTLASLAWIFFSSLNAAALQYEGEQGKMSISGYLEERGIYAFYKSSPDEDPSTEAGLELKGTYSNWFASKLMMKGVDDGKVIDPQNGRLFNQFNLIYQDKNPYIDISEAYLDFYTGKVDARVGIQKFAWGRLDEINPTDNLNTEDYTEGAINEEVDRKIGVPALKINGYSDLCNVEIGWVPRYVPYRLPTAEERWFPKPLKPPSEIPSSLVGTIPVQTSYDDISLPDFSLSHSETGIRISKYIEGWDISVSYFTGYDPVPVTGAAADVTVILHDPVSLDYSMSTDLTMIPEIHRMQVYGLDFSTTIGSFTVRGEYAYFKNKYYNRVVESVLEDTLTTQTQQEILDEFTREYIRSGGTKTIQTFRVDPQVSIQEDSMKYGLGLDYLYGDIALSFQVIQEYIPDFQEDKPIYFNKNGVDTLLTFLFKQFFLQNTMELNFRTAYNIEYRDYVIKPSLKYSFTNNIQGTVGLLIINSEYNDSLFGQYRKNDEVFAKIRLAF